MTSRRHLVLGSALLPWIAALPARAQAAPTRLLLGFPPGGTVDQISRHLSARLGEGVRVEVEQVVEIAPEKSGKYRYVVSKVDA